ncbi:MAG: ABC transporter permease [Chloroflexi bacterium]|nr:ABC transporter permease [Chloroflexota bacterium]
MTKFLIRRLLQAIPTLLAVSVVMFIIIHLAPGGPTAIYAMDPNVDQKELERIEERLGLNDPLPIQYSKWLKAMLSGDWGLSYKFNRPVIDILAERIGPSIQLVGAALLIALVFSIPFGMFSALYRNRFVQYLANAVAMLGVSIPTFWLGMVILLFFSVRWRIIPSGGMMTIGSEGWDLWDRLWHLLPPALVLATLQVAAWSRYVRSSMLEVIGQDYIRTARSKGLRERAVVVRHALKNALLPLITLVGLQGGNLIGGAMITEVVFAWPGMGRLLAESLTGRDYPVLMASFMLMSTLTIFGNMMADVCYGLVDPRIRLE